MSKLIIVSILILTLFSCQKKIEQINIVSELRGNTFNMNSLDEKDTITIEFKDSTFTIFEYNQRDLPWRVTTFNNSNILVLGEQIVVLKQENKDIFKGLFIGREDFKITLKKRKKQRDIALLNGIWIEKKNYSQNLNDSVQKLPTIPPLSGLSKSDFQYPPTYEIKGSTISVSYFYQEAKSNIEINNSNDFITMKLKRHRNEVEELWKIRKLTDSLMIIDRTVKKEDNKFSFLTITEKNIKLIK